MQVQAGEASSLNFKMMRVVPVHPRAVSVASLKPKFLDLRMDERLQARATQAARAREERRFASNLESPASASNTVRRPASEYGGDTSSARHEAEKGESAILHAHWVKNMVGGQEVGEHILHPDKFYGRPQRVKVDVDDVSPHSMSKQEKQEEAEKRKLIEELSLIRED